MLRNVKYLTIVTTGKLLLRKNRRSQNFDFLSFKSFSRG